MGICYFIKTFFKTLLILAFMIMPFLCFVGLFWAESRTELKEFSDSLYISVISAYIPVLVMYIYENSIFKSTTTVFAKWLSGISCGFVLFYTILFYIYSKANFQYYAEAVKYYTQNSKQANGNTYLQTQINLLPFMFPALCILVVFTFVSQYHNEIYSCDVSKLRSNSIEDLNNQTFKE